MVKIKTLTPSNAEKAVGQQALVFPTSSKEPWVYSRLVQHFLTK